MVAINIALNKNVTDCLDNPLSNIMVDGIKDPEKFETAESECMGRESYVEVHLRGTFAIHYVIVFAGNGTTTLLILFFNVLIVILIWLRLYAYYTFHKCMNVSKDIFNICEIFFETMTIIIIICLFV